eukprot:COSAG06_NODE_218_length_20036_cov_21.649446_4_plen_101_part_00
MESRAHLQSPACFAASHQVLSGTSSVGPRSSKHTGPRWRPLRAAPLAAPLVALAGLVAVLLVAVLLLTVPLLVAVLLPVAVLLAAALLVAALQPRLVVTL